MSSIPEVLRYRLELSDIRLLRFISSRATLITSPPGVPVYLGSNRLPLFLQRRVAAPIMGPEDEIQLRFDEALLGAKVKNVRGVIDYNTEYNSLLGGFRLQSCRRKQGVTSISSQGSLHR